MMVIRVLQLKYTFFEFLVIPLQVGNRQNGRAGVTGDDDDTESDSCSVSLLSIPSNE